MSSPPPPPGVTALPLRLVIFDCDGVLVDSEGVASRVVARLVGELGWRMTAAEAQAHFMGMALPDMAPVIERHTGRLVPAEWQAGLPRALMTALAEEAEPMPGAADALRAVAALGVPFRVASNSSTAEMAVKFRRCGLEALVGGRVHSGVEMARAKPAPDVFLAAAAAAGVAPGACLVVEDSVPGTEAAAAAGMARVGLAPHGDGADLAALGARVIRALAELPDVLRLSL